MNHRPLSSAAISLFLLGAPAAHALTPIEVHADLEFTLAGGNWTEELVVGVQGSASEQSIGGEDAFLVVPDVAWQLEDNRGARFERPPGAEWDFTGAAAGDPLWILTQSDNAIAWPGFENKQAGATFAPYSMNDERVTAAQRPWIQVRCEDVRYIGRGSGQFSLWQSAFGLTTVWISTSDDGLTDSDFFAMLEGGHDHANWGFSDLGVYVVSLRARAFLGADQSQPTESGIMPAVFAVGTHAIWKATQFDFAGLVDPGVVGDLQDPDRDGRVNLLEYAFNTDPLEADPATIIPGAGDRGSPAVYREGDRLVVEFVRRRDAGGPGLIYTPQFSSELAGAAAWVDAESAAPSVIDAHWERVRARSPASIGAAPAAFARVQVELAPLP